MDREEVAARAPFEPSPPPLGSAVAALAFNRETTAERRLAPILIAKSLSFLWPESKASTCSQVYCCCCCWTALRRRRQQQLARHLRKANLGATRFCRIQRDRCPSRDCRSRSPVAGLFGPFHRRLSTGAERFLDRFAQTHGGQQSGLCLFVRRPFRSSVPRSRLGRSLEVES